MQNCNVLENGNRSLSNSNRIDEDKEINVMICIYTRKEEAPEENYITDCLKKIQGRLEMQEKNAHIAFAYGCQDTVVLKKFRRWSEKNVIGSFYECKKPSVSLTHIWLMAMALIEKKYKEDRSGNVDADNILVLISDEDFPTLDDDLILKAMDIRFRDLEFTPVLMINKNGSRPKSRFEKYMEAKRELMNNRR